MTFQLCYLGMNGANGVQTPSGGGLVVPSRYSRIDDQVNLRGIKD